MELLEIIPTSYQEIAWYRTFEECQPGIFYLIKKPITEVRKLRGTTFLIKFGDQEPPVFVFNNPKFALYWKSIACLLVQRSNENLVLVKTSTISDKFDNEIGLVAKYRGTQGKNIRKLIDDYDFSIFNELHQENIIPYAIPELLEKLHFPQEFPTKEEKALWVQEINYARLLVKIVVLATNYQRVLVDRPPMIVPMDFLSKFEQGTGMNLSNDQRKICQEINQSFAHKTRMIRYLISDVGSGKSIVAFYAMILKATTGQKALLLVPSIILARQHYQNLSRLVDPETILLLNYQEDNKREWQEKLKSPQIKYIISTRVINTRYQIENLGLIIIDEEQKFGVKDRNKLLKEHQQVDLLIMSATCTPRTALLIKLLNIPMSCIQDRTTNRKIDTHIVNDQESRQKMNQFIMENISLENQLIIICPAIDEDSKLLSTNATVERITKHLGSQFKVAEVHGRNKNNAELLGAFSRGEYHILVATTVIEVGIDLPSANNMVIYHADRFGIANLQQLRGRVGRKSLSGHCFLVVDSDTSLPRLQFFADHQSGLELVMYDLQSRGVGELVGVLQSGNVDLASHLVEDKGLLDRVYQDINRIQMQMSQYPRLSEMVAQTEIDLN